MDAAFENDPALDRETMIQLAAELGRELQATGIAEPECAKHHALHDMLRDETYRADHRRRIPSEYSRGKILYVFDLWLENDWLPAGKTHLACLPCIAKPGDEGPIMIVPVSFAGDKEFFGVAMG